MQDATLTILTISRNQVNILQIQLVAIPTFFKMCSLKYILNRDHFNLTETILPLSMTAFVYNHILTVI